MEARGGGGGGGGGGGVGWLRANMKKYENYERYELDFLFLKSPLLLAGKGNNVSREGEVLAFAPHTSV